MTNCGGIVLCGGQSTRMGFPKAMLPFGDERMLTRVVRLVGQVSSPVVVVAAPGQSLPPLPEPVKVVRDRREGRGPLEGLAAGLESLDGVEAAFLTSCDVPLLRPGFVQRMVQLLGDYDIAIPHVGEYHHPLAAVYKTTVLSHVQALLAEDRLRPFFLLERVRAKIVAAEELSDVDPELKSLSNLNRPEDYRAALREAGFDPPQGWEP